MSLIDNLKQSMQNIGDTISDAFNFHPKYYLEPPQPPADPTDPDDKKEWVDKVLNTIKTARAQGKNLLASNEVWKLHLVCENFPPQYLEYYQKLQKDIAFIIKDEELRPTITLKIRGSNRLNSKPMYGYIGGTGPESDAATLLAVRRIYDDRRGEDAAEKDMAVDLLSAPPPREDKSVDHLTRYAIRVSKFAGDCGAANIILLSNTAHINLIEAKIGMQLRRLWKLDFINLILSLTRNSETEINSMVKRVVRNIKDGDTPEQKFDNTKDSILILGTEHAQKKELYKEKFDNYKMPCKYPDKDGRFLQALIEEIKWGHTNEPIIGSGKTVGETLVQFMLDTFDAKTTHILLACTELPLCLHTEIPQALLEKYNITDPSATYYDVFIQEFGKIHPGVEFPIIVDTEEKFAEYTVVKQLENEAKFHNLPVPPAVSKVGHRLKCISSSEGLNSTIELPASVASKTAIPVPRTFYENAHPFTQMDHFAEKDLIIYRPQEQGVTVDFTNQTLAVKKEMVIATIEAGLKLGVTQPIELTGDDFEAVKAGAEYCASKGIGFYVVAENIAQCLLPLGLQCGEPGGVANVPEQEVIANIESLTQIAVARHTPKSRM